MIVLNDVFSCSLVCFYSSRCRTVKYICGIPNYERDTVYIDFSANCRLPILKVPPEMLLFYALLTLWLLFLRADSLLEYLHWWHSLRYVFSGERFLAFGTSVCNVQCKSAKGSARGLVLIIGARPPANLSLSRLKSSC